MINSLDEKQESEQSRSIAEDIIKKLKQKKATGGEVALSTNVGYSVEVRDAAIETLAYHRDRGLGISVYFGTRKGAASTTDLTPSSIDATIEAACAIARHTHEDPYSGLADIERMAWEYPELDLCFPWDLSTEKAIELAIDCEKQARNKDKRIVNTDGASISTNQSIYTYANTHGFTGGYATTRHSMSCVLIAISGGEMQRDYDYTVARDPNDLMSIESIATGAAARTVRRLDARGLKTCQVPVLYAPEVARSLFGHFLSGVSGSQLYRKSSFLLDALGKSIFPSFINLYEAPHLQKGLGSAPFDGEGVRTQARDLVKAGVLKGYVLDTYSARKLGLQTTGNAGGVHNLEVTTSEKTQEELIKEMDTGVLITELLGQGVNMVTGDYSRGAAGFWIEGGEIQYPVEGITIAGNLSEMFSKIIAIGNDIDRRGNVHTGSVLVEKMMIAGE